jgi:hypothetical protein
MTTKQVQLATATEHQRELTRLAIKQAIKHEQQKATSKRPITLPRLAWMERPFLLDD